MSISFFLRHRVDYMCYSNVCMLLLFGFFFGVITTRVFNRLWTKAYFMSDSKIARIQDRMNKGLEVKEKAFKSWEENPLEDNVTLLVTRATLKEYGNLAGQLAVARPDVLVTRVATRAVTMSSAPLKGYREKMCKAGFGPYRGLNVPSSGWVMGYMMLKLCDAISIYGFGVEGMAQASRGLPTSLDVVDKGSSNITYHYFRGLGARSEGNDVHSFDTEERAFEALGAALPDRVTFCKYRKGAGDRNWACGCRASEGIEGCKPEKLPPGTFPLVDCFPGVDCNDKERRALRGYFERNQKRPGFDA